MQWSRRVLLHVSHHGESSSKRALYVPAAEPTGAVLRGLPVLRVHRAVPCAKQRTIDGLGRSKFGEKQTHSNPCHFHSEVEEFLM